MCFNVINMTTTAKRKRLLPSLRLLPISYRLASKNITNLIYLVILPNLILSLGQLFANQAESKSADFKIMGTVLITAGFIWLIINQAPIIYFAVRAVKGETPTLSESYRGGLKFFWQYLLLILVLVTIIGLGLALFILPGLVAAYFILQRYYLTPYFMIDQKLPIREALAKCNEQTKPYFLNILDVLFLQVTLVLSAAIVGVASMLIGIALSTFIASLTVFLLALRYQEITGKLPSDVVSK